MQECRVCGLLFLGGGACPSCGSQVAVDVNTDDIVMDDESIPGLDDIADAIGDTEDENSSNAEVLPFGMGAKAEVIQSSLPFGVGSFSDSVTEVAIPIGEQDYEEDSIEEESAVIEHDVEEHTEVDEEPQILEPQISESIISETTGEDFEKADDLAIGVGVSEEITETMISPETGPLIAQTVEEELPAAEVVEITPAQEVVIDDVPDMWRIDAAAVDMEAIYAQDEQIVEVSFEEDIEDSDVQVSFDDFHYSPEEDSMASDDDAPGLHPC